MNARTPVSAIHTTRTPRHAATTTRSHVARHDVLHQHNHTEHSSHLWPQEPKCMSILTKSYRPSPALKHRGNARDARDDQSQRSAQITKHDKLDQPPGLPSRASLQTKLPCCFFGVGVEPTDPSVQSQRGRGSVAGLAPTLLSCILFN